MRFNVIICTFQRPEAIARLMESMVSQSLYPDEVLIIDGSIDDLTRKFFESYTIPGLKYIKLDEEKRGLTRQRNYGISRTWDEIEVICFLDDDVVLTPDYFKNLIGTYKSNENAVGVGGYISNQVNWIKSNRQPSFKEYKFDGWIRKLGSRYSFRKLFSLVSDRQPGYMPGFSNGYPIGFLPPSGKIYPVEFFMGGVASYRKEIFKKVKFSEYFEGYGLYEDMDFCLRVSRLGQIYVNTQAQLIHLHDESSRPNKFRYGKMVIRNGWYVWRVKYPTPSFINRFKWHSTGFLLLLVRLSNIITTPKRMEAFSESFGRIAGWISLFFKKPV